MKEKFVQFVSPLADLLNIRPDLAAHAIISIFLVLGIYTMVALLDQGNAKRKLATFWLAFMLTLAWEIFYYIFRAIDVQYSDLLANAAGFVVGLIIMAVLDLIINRNPNKL